MGGGMDGWGDVPLEEIHLTSQTQMNLHEAGKQWHLNVNTTISIVLFSVLLEILFTHTYIYNMILVTYLLAKCNE